MVVDTHGKLSGIFTGRDAICRVLSENRSPEHTILSKVMTPAPCCLSPDKSAIEALRLMRMGGFRHVPVAEPGRSSASCHALTSSVLKSSGSMKKLFGKKCDGLEPSTGRRRVCQWRLPYDDTTGLGKRPCLMQQTRIFLNLCDAPCRPTRSQSTAKPLVTPDGSLERCAVGGIAHRIARRSIARKGTSGSRKRPPDSCANQAAHKIFNAIDPSQHPSANRLQYELIQIEGGLHVVPGHHSQNSMAHRRIGHRP